MDATGSGAQPRDMTWAGLRRLIAFALFSQTQSDDNSAFIYSMTNKFLTAIQELAEIKQLQKRRALKEPVLNAQRLKMEKRLRKLDMEIDDILMERISGI